MFSSQTTLLHILLLITVSICEECHERSFGEDSFVCVCDQVSCDDFPEVIDPPTGFYSVLTSTRAGLRFHFENGSMDSYSDMKSDAIIFVNSSDVRQSMLGFGGAFTDSTGINVVSLSEPLQETLIKQYFSQDGIEYNFARLPIAGTDFSTYPYTYDDIEGDVNLRFFNLTEADYLYKIPLIQRANAWSSRPLNLLASPWSPPSWMKENGMINGTAGLLPHMRQPWANYFVKFLDAYNDEGIRVWGLTVQNEPMATNYGWNACRFTSQQERDFVRDFLGPTLHGMGYDAVKIVIGDDNRYIYPKFLKMILNDSECSSYVDGIAVHWYSDFSTSTSILDDVHDLFPDKFILYTEACSGFVPGTNVPVLLGSWERGETYASDIINNVNHWTTGWVDWNLALNMEGGPSWVGNAVDSPIIVNKDKNEFYKQPMFYVMGHFSKFIPQGAKYVASTVLIVSSHDRIGREKIDVSCFLDPAGFTVVVILSTYEEEKFVLIEDMSGNSFGRTLPAKSIQTIVYKEQY